MIDDHQRTMLKAELFQPARFGNNKLVAKGSSRPHTALVRRLTAPGKGLSLSLKKKTLLKEKLHKMLNKRDKKWVGEGTIDPPPGF